MKKTAYKNENSKCFGEHYFKSGSVGSGFSVDLFLKMNEKGKLKMNLSDERYKELMSYVKPPGSKVFLEELKKASSEISQKHEIEQNKKELLKAIRKKEIAVKKEN